MHNPETTKVTNPHNKRWLVSVGSTLAFLVLIGYYIYVNWPEFSTLSIDSPYALIGLIICIAFNGFSMGMIMDIVLRPLGLRLHHMESFGLASLARLSNQVSPGNVGFMMRAAYLKRKHKFSYTDFLSTLGATHILMYFVASILGILSVWRLSESFEIAATVFATIFIGVFLVLLVLLVLPMKRWETKTRFLKHLAELLNGWQTIRRDRQTLSLSTLWTILFLLSFAGMILFAFSSLGHEISLVTALFFMAVTIAGGVIAITPAGLGINEGLILIAATAIGIEPTIALGAALLQRAAVFAVLIVITPFFSRRLFNQSLIGLLHRSQDKQPT